MPSSKLPVKQEKGQATIPVSPQEVVAMDALNTIGAILKERGFARPMVAQL